MPKVNGSLFALSPEFVVNLTDSHYGKVTVSLLLAQAPTAQGLATPPRPSSPGRGAADPRDHHQRPDRDPVKRR